VEVNREVAEAYMKALEELRGRFGVKTEPDLIALFDCRAWWPRRA